MVNHNNIPHQHCPCCDKKIDSATPIEDAPKPKPEDICICLGCGSILVYDKNLFLQMPSNELIIELSSDDEFMQRLVKIRAALYVIKNSN